VACSGFHSLIVSQSGSLWVCSHMISTCLGHDTLGNSFPNPVRINPFSFNEEAIVVVSAYSTRSVAVTASGGLYTWGSEPESMYKGLFFHFSQHTTGMKAHYNIFHNESCTRVSLSNT